MSEISFKQLLSEVESLPQNKSAGVTLFRVSTQEIKMVLEAASGIQFNRLYSKSRRSA